MNDTENNEENERKFSESHRNQLAVLKTLSSRIETTTENPRQFEIKEIAERTGLGDEKEVQRYLYILEGQKLVSPFPEGDFTSKMWQITGEGLSILANTKAA